MTFDIFHVDWIFVDTLLVILLIIFLIGVKIFKEANRWRISISNEKLDKIKIKNPHIQIEDLNPIIKGWNLTYMIDSSEEMPTILILRTFRKFMLLNAITEGLSSYGFNVINIWFKPFSRKSSTLGLIDLEKILKFHKDIIRSEEFIIKSYGTFDSSLQYYRTSKCKGLILVNYRFNKDKLETLKSIIDKVQVNLIYSEKLLLKIRRKSIKKIKRSLSNESNNPKIIYIDNSSSTFKYYETILLGHLIDIMKNTGN